MINKYLICIGLLVLLLSNFVGAVVVSEPEISTQTISAQNLGELNIKISGLEQKINALATDETILKYLNNQVALQNQLLETHKSTMIISQILINLCFLVLGGTGYFYFKSKGRT